jgi:glycosyltransferase involved in cell wall biosynthesis
VRVLVAHNHYRQRAGEDRVFATETALLQDYGHTVMTYTVQNDDIPDRPGLRVALQTIWNQDRCRDFRTVIRRTAPDVVHFHNTFPVLSPASVHAARAERRPVVMTLHNYRFFCANAVLFRAGKVCETCVGRPVAWPALVHRCYRHSLGATAVVVGMQSVHRIAHTLQRNVDAFIALSESQKARLGRYGLPTSRIFVKPHAIYPDPQPGFGRGGYAIFVGRLSAEKGVGTLLEAMRRVAAPLPTLLVGDGPLASMVEQAARTDPRLQWLGARSPAEVAALIGDAAFTIVPSEAHETFGLVVAESLAKGTPVLVSHAGALPDLIASSGAGRTFATGDPVSLAWEIDWFAQHPPERAAMRERARRRYETAYDGAASHDRLVAIYRRAIERQARSVARIA